MRGEIVKTVAEIAAEIGVSKQAVYKKIKCKPLSVSLQQFMSTKNNKLTVNDDGITLIKQEFNKKTVNQSVNQSSTKSSTVDTLVDGELIEILKENMAVLQEQLRIKDNQIGELTVTIKNLSESINAANKNELAETIIDGNQKLIERDKIKNRGGIFKIFSRKK